MARPKANEGTNKSDIVRAYLRTNSNATVRQIVEDLKSYDITPSLAQKIKYKDGVKRGRRGRKPGGAAGRPIQSSSESAAPTKADHIRRVAQGMGKRVRPRDVIAALNAEGISVSFAQVGQVLKGRGMRRRRGRRPGTARSMRPEAASSAA